MKLDHAADVALSTTVLEQGVPLRRVDSRRAEMRAIKLRLFLTCWIIYALHFSPYVYRELYLSMSLAEKHSIHVDDYVDLHPDLFVMPGRGSFLGHNPGTSILAAIPYWFSLPLVNRIAPVRPPKPGQAVSEQYNTPYADRLEWYQKVRARGLDVHLGAAAAITAVFFMAPLTALSVVVIFVLLRRMKFPSKVALWLALLYAFGTPMFFRTATISLNLLVALLGVFALALVWWPEASEESERIRYVLAGLVIGYTIVTDYTGIILVFGLGGLALLLQLQVKPLWPALKRCLWLVAGTVPPGLFMMGWQWYCYGSPWTPAQFVMPKKFFMGYPSARGVGWPLPEALWGLLFDPLYGLFVFAPIFVLILYHFVVLRRRQNLLPGSIAAFAWFVFAGTWLFCSCIHYVLRFQWMDGFRYLIPVIPFLFLLLADVLVRIPRWITYVMAFAAVFETWCLSMVRENPMDSILRVMLHGFELPSLTTLANAAAQYFPFLSQGVSPTALFIVTGVLIWGIWSLPQPGRPLLGRGDGSFEVQGN